MHLKKVILCICFILLGLPYTSSADGGDEDIITEEPYRYSLRLGVGPLLSFRNFDQPTPGMPRTLRTYWGINIDFDGIYYFRHNKWSVGVGANFSSSNRRLSRSLHFPQTTSYGEVANEQTVESNQFMLNVGYSPVEPIRLFAGVSYLSITATDWGGYSSYHGSGYYNPDSGYYLYVSMGAIYKDENVSVQKSGLGINLGVNFTGPRTRIGRFYAQFRANIPTFKMPSQEFSYYVEIDTVRTEYYENYDSRDWSISASIGLELLSRRYQKAATPIRRNVDIYSN